MSNGNDKSRVWMRRALVASLAVNLLVLGVVAGSVVRDGPPRGGPRFDLTAGPVLRAMDESDREAVRAALRTTDVFRPNTRDAMREDMELLLDVLRAPDFDRAAFTEAMSRQRVRLQSGQDAALEAVTNQIDAMSAEARAAYADRLAEQVRRGPPSRRDRSGG